MANICEKFMNLEQWTAIISNGEAQKNNVHLNRSEEYCVSNCKDILHGTANTRTKGGEH